MWRAPLAIILALGSGVLVAGGEPASLPQAPAPRAIPIDELVRHLGSDDFAAREAATKRLASLAIDPPPGVLAAAKSDDPELRERARKVVDAMRLNVASARLPRGQRFAEQGAIDLFVAATLVWELKADDPRLWEPALDLGRTLLTKAKMTEGRQPTECPATFPTFAAYKRYCNPRFTRVNELYQRQDRPTAGQPRGWYPEAIQAPGVSEGFGLVYNVVVSRGDVNVKTGILASVVFANGNVTTGQQISRSVVVCDGDVEVGEQFRAALVIARGNITSKQGASGGVLIAGGKITLNGQEQRQTTDNHFVLTDEKAVTPLGFITFFEVSRVGLEVKAEDGAVRVVAVAVGQAGDKAGLKVGDAILDVNGKKPADGESLRRLLRDALAVGDAAVKLQRGDKIETVKLSLPD